MGLNKSRPVYDRLRIDPQGRAHLIVTDQCRLPEDLLGAELGFFNIEIWCVDIGESSGAACSSFCDTADLLSQLEHRLSRERVGLRLYAAGTEGFLWDVMHSARRSGMRSEEVFLTHSGSLRRRVYCSHCKTISQDVTTNIATCGGCGAGLLVRDHFSRRLAAFMGVQVDAEVPGEIPEIEILYP